MPQRVTLAALLALFATGCLGGDEPLPPQAALAKAANRITAMIGENSQPKPITNSNESIEVPSKSNDISLWFFQHPVYSPLLGRPEVKKAFHDQHPGVTLNEQFIGEWPIAVQKLVVNLAAGDAPDIAVVKRGWLARLVQAGRLAPLDMLLPPKFVSDFREPCRRALTLDGHLYALPADGFCSVLFFNQDLLGETPPKTWEELLAAGLRLKAKPPGGGAPGKAYALGDLPFLESLWSAGGDLAKGDRCGLTDPDAVETLNYLLSLRDEGLVPPDVLGNSGRAFDLFMAGRVAMTVASSEYLAKTRDAMFRVGVAPVPGKTGPISRYSDNALVVFNRYAAAKHEGIADVLDLLTGPALQGRAAVLFGSVPVRNSVLATTENVPPGLNGAFQASLGAPLAPRWSEMESETMRYVGLALLWQKSAS